MRREGGGGGRWEERRESWGEGKGVREKGEGAVCPLFPHIFLHSDN